MATLNVLFPFASTAEGFTGVPYGSGFTLTYDGAEGNPAGSLETDVLGRNKAGISYWEWVGTWEDLGIPTGDTVTQVQLANGDSRCTLFNFVDAASIGPYEIWDSTGTVLIATLWTGRTITGVEGSYVSVGPITYQTVSSTYEASNTSIRIRIYTDIDLDNNAAAQLTLYEDNVNINVDYDEAGGNDLTGDDVISGISAVSDPTIEQIEVFDDPFILALWVILTWGFYEIWFLTSRYEQLDQEYDSYPSECKEREKLIEIFRIQFSSFGLLAWIALSVSLIILMITTNFYIELGFSFGTLGVTISFVVIFFIYLTKKFTTAEAFIQ